SPWSASRNLASASPADVAFWRTMSQAIFSASQFIVLAPTCAAAIFAKAGVRIRRDGWDMSVATSGMKTSGQVREMQIRNAILIAGPTASGKSALALDIAERSGAAIVNTDSMQGYSILNVLTARPEPDDMARAPHHLYGPLFSCVGRRNFRNAGNPGGHSRALAKRTEGTRFGGVARTAGTQGPAGGGAPEAWRRTAHRAGTGSAGSFRSLHPALAGAPRPAAHRPRKRPVFCHRNKQAGPGGAHRSTVR